MNERPGREDRGRWRTCIAQTLSYPQAARFSLSLNCQRSPIIDNSRPHHSQTVSIYIGLRSCCLLVHTHLCTAPRGTERIWNFLTCSPALFTHVARGRLFIHLASYLPLSVLWSMKIQSYPSGSCSFMGRQATHTHHHLPVP